MKLTDKYIWKYAGIILFCCIHYSVCPNGNLPKKMARIFIHLLNFSCIYLQITKISMNYYFRRLTIKYFTLSKHKVQIETLPLSKGAGDEFQVPNIFEFGIYKLMY